jgi:DNA-binding PadR family transcriptional regulator
MALSYAILSLLTRGDASGYDLLKSFEGSVANFWYAGHPQIYKELAALERRALVSHRVVVQDGRPNKKVFRITPAGREDLLRWLRSPHRNERHNSLATLKAFSLHLLPADEAIAKVEELATEGRKELERYRAIEKMLAPLAENSGAMLSAYLSVLFGLNYAEAYQRWCAQAKALLLKAAARAEGRASRARRR